MRIELASEPATPSAANEDYAAVALPASGTGGALLVLDGVTPPRDGGTGCTHGVPWFAARLGGAFLELAAARRETTLAGCLAEAVSRTAAAHGPGCDLTHPRTPQATVAAARWDGGTVEYLVLCDSVLLVERPDGAVVPVLDERLDTLTPEVRAMRTAVRALPPGSAERAAAGRECARAVEALRNQEGGFFTAAADPEVAGRAVTGSLARTEVTALGALTDGVTRWSEVLRLGDWTQLFLQLRKAGPQGVVEQVRAAESADADRSRFPRGKTHDDASAVFAEL